MENLGMGIGLKAARIAHFCCSLLTSILVMASIAHGSAAQEASSALPEVVQASVPLYPADALAAHVAGVVHLHVSTDGKAVTGTSEESGPAMLVKAAEESVRTWGFAPHAATSFDVTFNYKLADSTKCETGSRTVVLHLPREVEVDGMSSQCDMVRFAKQQKFLSEQRVYPVELAITLNGKPIELPREVSISNGTDSVMLQTIDGMFLAPQAMKGGAPLIFRTVIGKELIEVKGIPANTLEAVWRITLSDSESSPDLDLPKGMSVKTACSIAFASLEGNGTSMTVGACRKPIE
jgi:hypothetical protein